MKQKIASILAAVTLMLGFGLAAGAPAQAVTGSLVEFSSKASNVPSSVHLRVVDTSGRFYYKNLGDSTFNVHHYYAPDGYSLYYKYVGGSSWIGPYSGTIYPKYASHYKVRMVRS